MMPPGAGRLRTSSAHHLAGTRRTIHIAADSSARTVAMRVVGGSASVALAKGIARELKVAFVDVAFEKHPGGFPDGERYVRLLGPVAGEDVILVQTTHPDPMIVELFLLADAIRDAGAGRLTAVVPYFGYGRQDKRFLDGEAVSAKTIAKHIAVECDELLTMAIPANPEILKTFPLPTAAKELRKQGARRVVAACVHGLFVGKAEENLKAVDEVIATDTVQSPHTKVSVAPEFAAASRALG